MNSIDFNGLNMAESPTNMLFSTDVRLQNQVNQVNHLFDGLGKDRARTYGGGLGDLSPIPIIHPVRL